MKTEAEIKEKIELLEKYLEGGKPITNLYPLERTESFVGGLKWVLEKDKDSSPENSESNSPVGLGRSQSSVFETKPSGIKREQDAHVTSEGKLINERYINIFVLLI